MSYNFKTLYLLNNGDYQSCINRQIFYNNNNNNNNNESQLLDF